jgi:hypothetical protein
MESWAGMAGSHGSSLPAPGTLTADATAPAELVAGPGEHPVDTPARVAGRVVVRIGGTVHRDGGSSERQGPDEQGLVEGSGCRDQQCDAAWRGRGPTHRRRPRADAARPTYRTCGVAIRTGRRGTGDPAGGGSIRRAGLGDLRPDHVAASARPEPNSCNTASAAHPRAGRIPVALGPRGRTSVQDRGSGTCH